MLQQTQVVRVIPKYTEFIQKFPTIRSLAEANTADVLKIWKGLGYNRRALFLKKACEKLNQNSINETSFPKDKRELVSLPGIGQSTAGAIMAFAFNIPEPFIETNIRAVFMYHFFKKSSSVSDTTILDVVQQTIDVRNPREWYYALYDYGTFLKESLGKEKTALHRKSNTYTKQSMFKGSNREIRSTILSLFTLDDSPIRISLDEIIQVVSERLTQATKENIQRNTEALCKEGFLKSIKGESKNGPVLWYTLATT